MLAQLVEFVDNVQATIIALQRIQGMIATKSVTLDYSALFDTKIIRRIWRSVCS
jgi:hypothetical protein